MTTASKTLCISADSHVVESAEFFEPLQKRFGDRAPRVEIPDEAQGPKLNLGNGKMGLGISGFLQQNVDFTSPEARASQALGYKLARPGCYDTAERLKDPSRRRRATSTACARWRSSHASRRSKPSSRGPVAMPSTSSVGCAEFRALLACPRTALRAS